MERSTPLVPEATSPLQALGPASGVADAASRPPNHGTRLLKQVLSPRRRWSEARSSSAPRRKLDRAPKSRSALRLPWLYLSIPETGSSKGGRSLYNGMYDASLPQIWIRSIRPLAPDPPLSPIQRAVSVARVPSRLEGLPPSKAESSTGAGEGQQVAQPRRLGCLVGRWETSSFDGARTSS